MTKTSHCLTLAAALCALSTEAFAQAPDWTMKITIGKPLYVTMLDGARVEGVAASVTADEISVATLTGVRAVALREIRRVQKRDALWTGAAIGAGVGTLLGVAALAGEDGLCDTYGSGCDSEAAAVVIGGALYGALVGWGIDALVKGRHTIFDGPRAPRVSLSARPKGVSARLTIAW